jgi:hypothetical protein
VQIPHSFLHFHLPSSKWPHYHWLLGQLIFDEKISRPKPSMLRCVASTIGSAAQFMAALKKQSISSLKPCHLCSESTHPVYLAIRAIYEPTPSTLRCSTASHPTSMITMIHIPDPRFIPAVPSAQRYWHIQSGSGRYPELTSLSPWSLVLKPNANLGSPCCLLTTRLAGKKSLIPISSKLVPDK